MKKNSNKLEYYLKLDYSIVIKSELIDSNKNFVAFCHELGKRSCYGIGNTAIEAVQNFIENKENFINLLYEQDMIIPEPVESIKDDDKLSGIFNVRTSPIIHGKLFQQARENNVSLNMLVNQILSKSTVEQSIEKIISISTDKIIDKIDKHHRVMAFNAVKYNHQPIASDYNNFSQNWKPKTFIDN